MKHILLQGIEFKKVCEITPPENFAYNRDVGAWVSEMDSSLLVLHPEFSGVASKKKDIETGEDQK